MIIILYRHTHFYNLDIDINKWILCMSSSHPKRYYIIEKELVNKILSKPSRSFKKNKNEDSKLKESDDELPVRGDGGGEKQDDKTDKSDSTYIEDISFRIVGWNLR